MQELLERLAEADAGSPHLNMDILEAIALPETVYGFPVKEWRRRAYQFDAIVRSPIGLRTYKDAARSPAYTTDPAVCFALLLPLVSEFNLEIYDDVNHVTCKRADNGSELFAAHRQLAVAFAMTYIQAQML